LEKITPKKTIMSNEKKKPGRKGERPVHPSWEPYLHLFDSEDQHRSQGAFCRWCWSNGVHLLSCNISSAKRKELKPELKELIERWRDETERSI
jgi:hypothetical protein